MFSCSSSEMVLGCIQLLAEQPRTETQEVHPHILHSSQLGELLTSYLSHQLRKVHMFSCSPFETLLHCTNPSPQTQSGTHPQKVDQRILQMPRRDLLGSARGLAKSTS